MTWDDYYSRFYDLAPSTQKNYSYKLTNFGPAEEVFEIINEFAFDDEAFASRFTAKALAAGVRFTPEQVLEATILLDRAVLSNMAETATGRFTLEQLEELDSLIDDSSFEMISEKSGFYFSSDDPEEITENPNAFVKPRQKQTGFWITLFSLLGVLGSDGGKKRDDGICDGDCSSCPAHYGYRYGRWYYGHGHQHSCQRGGNGGASGKTYRD